MNVYQEVTDGDFNNLMEEILRSTNDYDNATCESLLVEDSKAKKMLLESPDLVKRGAATGGKFKKPTDRGSMNLNAYYDSLFNSFLEYSKDPRSRFRLSKKDDVPNHNSNNLEARKELKKALQDESYPNYNSQQDPKMITLSGRNLSKQQMIDLSSGLSMFLRSKIDSFVEEFQKDISQRKGSVESMVRALPSSQFSDKNLNPNKDILISGTGSEILKAGIESRNSLTGNKRTQTNSRGSLIKNRPIPRLEDQKTENLKNPPSNLPKAEGSQIKFGKKKKTPKKPSEKKTAKKKTTPISINKKPTKKKDLKETNKKSASTTQTLEEKRRSKKIIKKMNIQDLKIIQEKSHESGKYDSEKGNAVRNKYDSGRTKYDSGRNKVKSKKAKEKASKFTKNKKS